MDSVRYVLQAGDVQPRSNTAYVARLIEQAGAAGISRSALTKAFGSRGDAAALDVALEELLVRPGFAMRDVQTAGRPSRCYRYQAPTESTPRLVSSSFRTGSGSGPAGEPAS